MTTIDAKLRLQAQFGEALQALSGLRSVIKEVAGEAGKPSVAVPFKPMRDGIASVSRQLAEAKTQLLALFAAQSVGQGLATVARVADGYANLSARLRIVTKGQEEFNLALNKTRELAQQYQVPLDATTKLYTRMLAALRPLGGGLREAQVATESMLAALRISGATTEESSSAILQFSQALGAGALRGEEFNAIAEAAPRLLDALAAGIGKPRDQLKALAEQGALTTSTIVRALQQELPRLQAEADKMPATIGGAVQQLRDRFSTLVGATAETSAGVRAVVSAIKALADNLPALIALVGALVAGMAALKLGALAQGLYTAGAAAATGATGVSAFMLALRGGLAFITGPVGWIVALVSLAAAWAGLRKAQEKEKTPDALKDERSALQAEVDRLDQELAGNKSPGIQTVRDSWVAKEKLRRLKAELEPFDQAQYARDETARLLSRKPDPNESKLRDPTTIKAFEDKYESRAAIVKRYANELAGYVTAKDKEIAAARLDGNTKLEADLLAAKQEFIALAGKKEQEELKKFAADSTLSRLAIYKDEYNSRGELAADATARELKLNQSLLDQQLRSTKDYFAARAVLEDQESEQSIAKLQAELVRKEAVLAKNKALLAKAATANEKDAASEAVTGNQRDVDKTRTEIERQQRDAAERRRQRGVDEQLATRELERQSEELDYQTKALNNQLTLADLRLAAQRQYAEASRKEMAETGGTQQTDALIAAQVRVAELQRLQAEAQNYFASVQLAQSEIDRQVSLGTLSTLDAERQKFDARAKVVPQLQAILAAMKAIAKTDEEKLAIQSLIDKIGLLAVSTTAMQDVARGAVSSGFAQLFTDVATGAKSAGDAVRDFVGGVARSMLDLIAKQLGDQLMKSLMGDKEGNGGWMSAVGNAIVSAFSHHTGGVVGAGGSPRYAPLLAFANAPRYHSGGIAGLRPGEVPAVLMKGEEVLTADDPRHVRNFKAGGGDVNIAVKVEGAQGSNADMGGAGNRLAGMIRGVVDQWATDESREGGILARGQR